MVNGPDDVYVEREGQLERAPEDHSGTEAVLHLMGWGAVPGVAGLMDNSSPAAVRASAHIAALPGKLLGPKAATPTHQQDR
jgi:hypothetical protein